MILCHLAVMLILVLIYAFIDSRLSKMEERLDIICHKLQKITKKM